MLDGMPAVRVKAEPLESERGVRKLLLFIFFFFYNTLHHFFSMFIQCTTPHPFALIQKTCFSHCDSLISPRCGTRVRGTCVGRGMALMALVGLQDGEKITAEVGMLSRFPVRASAFRLAILARHRHRCIHTLLLFSHSSLLFFNVITCVWVCVSVTPSACNTCL